MQTADEGKRILIVDGEGGIDALTGEKVSPLPEARDEVIANNRLRREIEGAIAAMQLLSRDRGVRLAAAKAMGVTSRGRVLTFKLGGTVALPEVASAPPPPAPPPLSAPAETVAEGEKLYHRHCLGCHGIGAVGGGVIADLRHARPEVHEAWNDIVLEGSYRERGMAPFAGVLTREGAQAIRAYVIKRAHEGDSPSGL